MLVLSRADVEALLDLDALVDAVGAAMVDLSAGSVSMPPRVAARVVDHDGMLAVMPVFLPSAGTLSTKLVSLFPRNVDRPTHQGLICCFDPSTGTPVAVMDAAYITATRTAAGSVLASRHLARPDSRVLSIVGSGFQARAHALAFRTRPGLEAVRLWSRDPASVRGLVDELRGEGMPAEAAGSLEDAVRSADIVCACTHADQPVVRREWLAPGAHVNSVGYNTSGPGEVDASVVRDALLVVESREAVLGAPPAGAVEILGAIAAGLIGPEHIHAEIGEIVAGLRPGRSDAGSLTLYKSVGVAVQDAAAANLVLTAAAAAGGTIGTEVDL